MTLSVQPEQTLRASVDRGGDPPSRRVARIAGIFMVITFISIPALPLYDQVLNHTNFIVGTGGGVTRVYLGALFEILTLIGGIGFAVTVYPVLKRQSQSLALGYVTVRVVESALIAVGIVSLLAVVTLRQDLAAGGADHASLILTGRSLVAVHDATFLLGPAFCAGIGNGLLLGYLMLRSGLVPRRFAQFGIFGGSLALITAILVLFGAYDQISGPSTILTAPEAVWELSLGIYLIAKGVKPSSVLYDAGLHAGVDGPLIPALAAPQAAAPVVVAR
jgi:hypothetical protein